MNAMNNVCEVEGCDKPRHGNFPWCKMHYTRWRRHGDPIKKLNLMGEYDVCQVEGCNRTDISGHGYCMKHYTRWKRHRDTSIIKRDGNQGCKIDGCNREHRCHGYCEIHYIRLRKYGDPLCIIRNFNRGRKCKIDGCDAPSRCNGYCCTHDHRMRRYNDPNRVKRWVSNLEMIAMAKLYQLGIHDYIFQFRYKNYFPGFGDDFKADFFILVKFLDLEVDGFYHRGREFNDLVRDLKVRNELNINTNRVKGTEVWKLKI